MNMCSERIKNSKRHDQWRRKAQPASIERCGKACADVMLIWNTDGPVSWKVYELKLLRVMPPIAVAFEIDLLIGMLEVDL